MVRQPRDISKHRRIAQECSPIECGVEEMFLDDGRRVISFHNRPDQFEQHKFLIESGVAVLDLLQRTDANHDDFSLIVPRGTTSIQDQLKSIARNVGEYSDIFVLIGEYLRELHEKCELLPVATTDWGLLSSLIAIPSDSEDLGVSLVLTPPYCLGDTPFSEVYSSLIEELEKSGFFDEQQIGMLMQAFLWGTESDEWKN